MFGIILDALVYAGTPTRWPMLARRLFVLLFPITVPLLVAGWVVILGSFIAVCIVGCLWCICMEFINSMRLLWDGR